MIRIIVVAVLFLAGTSVAHAGLITVEWSGSIILDAALDIVPIQRGDSISGSFVFDNSSPVASIDGFGATYTTNHMSTFSINGFDVSGSGGFITVNPYYVVCPGFGCVDTQSIYFESNFFSGDLLGGFGVDTMEFSMGWLGGGGIDDNSLPSQINSPPFNIITDIFLQGGGGFVKAEIENIAFSSIPTGVPLPGTLALLGLGVVAMGLGRRRNSRRY